MADISSYLAAIMAAVYGEDVRGSIHDAIDIINKVGEVVLNTGTAVTGPTSSSTGFYNGSFYINTSTMELWKCIGTNAWQSQGVLKGGDGADGNGIVSIVKTATVGLVDTYTITFDDGTTETYQITNGQNGSKWYKGTAISGTGTSITGFPGTKDDYYLNSVDGYVYVCTKTGGAMLPDAAEWDYVMTLTGGGGASITVVDNLTSTSSTDALSANQGRALKGLIDAIPSMTVDQTYSASSTNAQSGTAVAEVAEQIYADNGVLGAKNINGSKYITETSASVTFTPTADNIITVNGTATNANAQTNDSAIYRFTAPVTAQVFLSGVPLNAPNGIILFAWDYTINSRPYADASMTTKQQADVTNNNPEVSFYMIKGNVYYVRIRVNQNAVVNNVAVSPMLRLATDPDDTYASYAMTNRELTEAIATIPTVNDGQLTIQQNGTNKATFTANQSGNATANIVTDEWTATAQVQSDNTVTFTGLDDSYAYDLYCQDKLIGASAMSKTGSGTSVTLAYTVTGASSGDVCKLRIVK